MAYLSIIAGYYFGNNIYIKAVIPAKAGIQAYVFYEMRRSAGQDLYDHNPRSRID